MAKGQSESDANLTMAGWRKARDNQFTGLQGPIIDLDWCDGDVADFETPTCVKFSVKVNQDGHDMVLTHNFIPGTTAVTPFGHPLVEHISSSEKKESTYMIQYGIVIYKKINTIFQMDNTLRNVRNLKEKRVVYFFIHIAKYAFIQTIFIVYALMMKVKSGMH